MFETRSLKIEESDFLDHERAVEKRRLPIIPAKARISSLMNRCGPWRSLTRQRLLPFELIKSKVQEKARQITVSPVLIFEFRSSWLDSLVAHYAMCRESFAARERKCSIQAFVMSPSPSAFS